MNRRISKSHIPLGAQSGLITPNALLISEWAATIRFWWNGKKYLTEMNVSVIEVVICIWSLGQLIYMRQTHWFIWGFVTPIRPSWLSFVHASYFLVSFSSTCYYLFLITRMILLVLKEVNKGSVLPVGSLTSLINIFNELPFNHDLSSWLICLIFIVDLRHSWVKVLWIVRASSVHKCSTLHALKRMPSVFESFTSSPGILVLNPCISSRYGFLFLCIILASLRDYWTSFIIWGSTLIGIKDVLELIGFRVG